MLCSSLLSGMFTFKMSFPSLFLLSLSLDSVIFFKKNDISSFFHHEIQDLLFYCSSSALVFHFTVKPKIYLELIFVKGIRSLFRFLL